MASDPSAASAQDLREGYVQALRAREGDTTARCPIGDPPRGAQQCLEGTPAPPLMQSPAVERLLRGRTHATPPGRAHKPFRRCRRLRLSAVTTSRHIATAHAENWSAELVGRPRALGRPARTRRSQRSSRRLLQIAQPRVLRGAELRLHLDKRSAPGWSLEGRGEVFNLSPDLSFA